jgi:large subunit ribosomal protein L30
MEKKTDLEKKKQSADSTGNRKIAIIRVRGLTGVMRGIDETLKKLRLYKKNYCVVVPRTENYLGMVRKISDYVTWGDIDEKTYNALTEKRMEEYKGRISDKKGKINYNKFTDANGKKIKKSFRLNSPKKGYGRKGIKVSFTKGGALGYRGDKINDLIMRMI